MPDPKTLSAGAYEKKMEELEGGVKAAQKKKKKKKIRLKPLQIKGTEKTSAPKPISISSALNREKTRESGITKPEAALRNAVSAKQFPKKKYT